MLESILPARGAEVNIVVLREVAESDIADLQLARNVGTVPLKKLREIHHRIALLMVTGQFDADVAAATGYSLTRLSILKNDPAFKELLEFYRDSRKKAETQVMENLSTLRNDAISELSERLEVEPESFSNRELMELLTTTADRTGHGPTSKSMNMHMGVSVNAAELAKLKQEASSANIVDVSSRKASSDSGTFDGPIFDVQPSGATKLESVSEEGVDVSTEGNAEVASGVDTGLSSSENGK